MARNITVIPARANRTNLAENLEPQEKKMASYCRVSTDQLEQLSSYEAQVSYYTTFMCKGNCGKNHLQTFGDN